MADFSSSKMSNKTEILSIPPPPTLYNNNNNNNNDEDKALRSANGKNTDKGWAWIVLLASFSSCVIFGGQQYGFSNYFVVFLYYFRETRSMTSWAGSLQAGIFHLTGPLTSILLPKVGPRALTMLGGIFMAIGFILLYFAESMVYVIVVYGILVGIGSCLMLSGSQASVTAYFDKHLFVASGVQFSGVGVGFLTLGLMSEYAIEHYGWRGSMFIQAGLCLQACVFSALVFKKVERSKKLSTVRSNVQQQQNVKTIAQPSQEIITVIETTMVKDIVPKTPTVKEYFQDVRFWCFNFATMMVHMGSLSVLIFFKDMLMQKEFFIYNLVLISLGSGSTVGRFTAGFISTIINPMLYYFIVALVNAVNISLFPLINTQWGFLAAGFVFGYCHGTAAILQTIKLIAVYGRSEMPKLWGYGLAYGCVGVLSGPPLFGYIKDKTGSFSGALFMCAGTVLAAGLLALIVFFIQLKRRRNRLVPYSEKTHK